MLLACEKKLYCSEVCVCQVEAPAPESCCRAQHKYSDMCAAAKKEVGRANRVAFLLHGASAGNMYHRCNLACSACS
jgi:hypothetical protein